MLKDVVLETGESDADEFTVSFWKVDPGSSVGKGDEIVVLESVEEKTALAVSSPVSGVLKSIVAGEDSTVRPGDLLCRVEVG
jgi:pyruvate/2-oxoglutarate dehydrogenase complex dihydrolipoamide acyltransferase (E2) component